MKEKLEKLRRKLQSISEIDPTDLSLNKELDESIRWVEYAILRLEARSDENKNWYKKSSNCKS